MKQDKVVLTLALLLAIWSWAWVADAQEAHPTAVRNLQLSAFGGVSGVFTGLSGGKNFSLTAGVDLALPPWRSVRPSLEVRGTYPADRGLVAAQKSVEGGLRVDFLLNHRIHPYGDFLFGRGQMNYRDGYIYNNEFYYLTTTYIDSAGLGFDCDVSDHLSLKVDAQAVRWGSAPTTSGRIYSTVGTLGIVYRFGFGGRSLP
jgi:hypothetical protein